MPTFPTYDGHLPQCLNPLNPRHYLLVLYWVFFRPTALKCYLYYSDPLLYKNYTDGWEIKNIIESSRNRSHRNLCLISLVIFILIGLLSVASMLIENPTIRFLFFILIGWMASCLFPVLTGINMNAPGELAESVLKVTCLGWLLELFAPMIFRLNDVLAFIIGSSRLPLFLLQFIILPGLVKFGQSHPVIWDEFATWPLPFSVQHLSLQIKRSPHKGLQQFAQIISNPLQTWVIYNTAWLYLRNSGSPIETIYNWATSEELSRYAQVPLTNYQWNKNVSSRQMLFAELVGVSLSPDGQVLSEFNNFPRWLTSPLRGQLIAPLQKLIALFLMPQTPIIIELTGLEKSFNELSFKFSEVQEIDKAPDWQEIIDVATHQMAVRLNLGSDLQLHENAIFNFPFNDHQLDFQLEDYPYGWEVKNSFVAISNRPLQK
jgi:hypothetical protein